MSIKMTRNDVKALAGNRPIYQVSYCSLQTLLSGNNAVGYNRGHYGWNFEVYDLGDLVITAGYRNMVGKVLPLEMTQKWEKKAEKMQFSKELSWKEARAKRIRLVTCFVKAVKKELEA